MEDPLDNQRRHVAGRHNRDVRHVARVQRPAQGATQGFSLLVQPGEEIQPRLAPFRAGLAAEVDPVGGLQGALMEKEERLWVPRVHIPDRKLVRPEVFSSSAREPTKEASSACAGPAAGCVFPWAATSSRPPRVSHQPS